MPAFLRLLFPCAIALCLFFASACRDQTAWIKKMGFVPLNPPSQLLSPGAVIMRRNNFSKIKLLCSAEESLGQDFSPSKSRTVGGRYRRGKKIGWKISGDALKQIKVAANSEEIQEIFVQVENARITALTDTDVLLAATKRSAACEAAIKRRVSEGWDISIISQSLTADVSYSVQFSSDSQADVTARLAQLQAVSVTLGGSFKATSDTSASAKNLVYGLKDDPFLAEIKSGDADVQALRGQSPVPSKRQSIFMPDESLTTPTADKSTQAPEDEDETPSWGVTTDNASAEPVPGFDDAVKDATDDEQSSSGGYIPSSGGAAPANDAAPVSPRSARRAN